MSNLNTNNLPKLSTIISDKIGNIIYNPVSIQGTILDHLENITGKQVDILDPTNPFIFALEASSVNASSCVNESLNHLREQYSSLSETDKELYKHLSDVDYIGRFSSPSTAIIDYTVPGDEIFIKGIEVVGKNYRLLTIPRNTEILVEGTKFLLLYPIDIKVYTDPSSGKTLNIYEVSYRTDKVSDIQNIYTKVIEHSLINSRDNIKWLTFSIPVKQLEVITNEFPVSVGDNFEVTINDIPNNFYYAEVYNKSISTSGSWVRLSTTHSENIYDIASPTARLKVLGNSLVVSIPPLYTASAAITGSIRIDIYSTNGEMFLSLKGIAFDNWKTKTIVLDPSTDTDVYTAASSDISFILSSTDLVHGGTNGLDFQTLRDRVIYNTVGLINKPITDRELTVLANDTGFDIHKAIDLVTERLYTVSRVMPNITNAVLEVKPSLTRQTINYTKTELLAVPGIIESNNSIIIQNY